MFDTRYKETQKKRGIYLRKRASLMKQYKDGKITAESFNVRKELLKKEFDNNE